jgi:hypothetical protein
MRLLSCLFSILLLGRLAGAQVAEPEWNPPPVIPALLAADNRLQQPVTLRFAQAPLSDILAEISRQCKVPLSVARDVAEEPSIVYMRERPAAEVLTHLAKLFDYSWQPTGSNETRATASTRTSGPARENRNCGSGRNASPWRRSRASSGSTSIWRGGTRKRSGRDTTRSARNTSASLRVGRRCRRR